MSNDRAQWFTTFKDREVQCQRSGDDEGANRNSYLAEQNRQAEIRERRELFNSHYQRGTI